MLILALKHNVACSLRLNSFVWIFWCLQILYASSRYLSPLFLYYIFQAYYADVRA